MGWNHRRPFGTVLPGTLHLWWARQPLATADAVLFPQMVATYVETLLGDAKLRRKVEPSLVDKTRQGAHGLAEDVRHYGRWMRDEAQQRIGHPHPTVEITPAMVRKRPDLKPYEGRTLTLGRDSKPINWK